MGSEACALDEQLFSAESTHIEVKCWSCGHCVTLKPGDVQEGMTDCEFEKRATCRCGTGWPYVSKFPKKPPLTM